MNFQQNNLSKASSPYLLQHQNNPVWWQTWSDEVLEYAQKVNKPLLISIGYSACHWCHVMEKESFEDEMVAQWMNAYFVCIKIDREERPDLDHLYMNVAQLIHQSGGWPLNVFALPNGQPFYGGTYFPKEQWVDLLKNIEQLYTHNPKKTEEYVSSIADGLTNLSLIELREPKKFSLEKIRETFEFWTQQFDENWGGFSRAPKFMLPNAWQTLLRYGYQTSDEKILIQTKVTLDRMMYGGLYDQLQGGFSRYSVDPYWKVPHFEKMLYDNGQLLSLYANGYKVFQEDAYKTVMEETITWLKTVMLSPEQAFYSAMDADSEHVEGKYYVWTSTELKEILGDDYSLFKDYYQVEDFGKWEENQSILMRLEDDEEFAEKNAIDLALLKDKVKRWKEKLLAVRVQRIPPHLDDKILTSWNALTITGLCDVFQATQHTEALDLAKKAMNFLMNTQWKEDRLYRNYKNSISDIPGFLDDYSLLIEAAIKLFETTTDIHYLDFANRLTEQTLKEFYNHRNGMFAYKSHYDTPLVSETFEIHDNVISSSNSVMANNLFNLGKMNGREDYIAKAEQMLTNVEEQLHDYPSGFAHWIKLFLNLTSPFHEVVIVGEEAENYLNEIQTYFMPNAVFIGSQTEELSITKHRLQEGKTTVHICQNSACQLPVNTINEALEQLTLKF